MIFRVAADRKNSVNKTIRFPVKMIFEIEKAIVGKDSTFTGFVIQACKYALRSLQDEKMYEMIMDSSDDQLLE